MHPLTPTPKVATALGAGALTTIVIWVLNDGFKVVVTGEHAAAITTVVSFLLSYIAPRSDKPDTDESETK